MAGLVITEPVELHVALTSAQVIPGDRIYLRGGIYTLTGLSCALRGTAQAHITISNYQDEPVTIIPASGSRCLTITGAYLDFADLIFDGTNVADEAIKVTDGASNILLSGLEIKNAGRHGILTSRSTNLTVQGCNIHDCGTTDLDHGIYVSSEVVNALISGNTIHDIVGYGVHCYGGEANASYTIEKNYIYNQTNKAGIGCFHGVSIIQNNVIRDSLRGIGVHYAAVHSHIYHNTILGCTQYGVYSNDTVSGNDLDVINNLFDSCDIGIIATNENAIAQTMTVKNNLYSRLTGNAVQIAGTVDLTRSGDITASVLPVTDNGAQFIPTTGSPALGAGFAIGVTVDYAGNARGNPPTIGAWE